MILRQTRPTQEDVREYHELALSTLRHRTGEEQERDAERHRKNLKRVQQVMGPPQEAGRVLLDIGTGRGEFLELAQQASWLVLGTELSPVVAAKAQEQRGIEVLAGQLTEIPFGGRTFDAITMWDVLDYLPNPGEALRFLHRLLRPRGVLFLSVTNADETMLKHKLKPTESNPLGDLEPGDDARLTHFQAKTLRQALTRNGYEIKDFSGEGKSGGGAWWAGPLKGALKLSSGMDLSPTLHAVVVTDRAPVKRAENYE